MRVTEKPVIKIQKTVYDAPEKSDGNRILVMKIWPRGISKDKVDLWVKDLRTDRDLVKKRKSGKVSWEEFTKEYNVSLKGKEDLLRNLAEEAEKGTITLLCSCKDEKHCHRYLLKKAIETKRLLLNIKQNSKTARYVGFLPIEQEGSPLSIDR